MKFIFFKCALLLILSLILFSCTKNKFKDIKFTVMVTPLVDSLPVTLELKHSTKNTPKEIHLTERNWTTSESIRIDTYVTLEATGTSNVKRIDVRIEGYHNSPAVEYCESSNCSVKARYDLY